jgi:hypothetical protein
MNAAELPLHKIATEQAMRRLLADGPDFAHRFFRQGAPAQPKKVCWFLE